MRSPPHSQIFQIIYNIICIDSVLYGSDYEKAKVLIVEKRYILYLRLIYIAVNYNRGK